MSEGSGNDPSAGCLWFLWAAWRAIVIECQQRKRAIVERWAQRKQSKPK